MKSSIKDFLALPIGFSAIVLLIFAVAETIEKIPVLGYSLLGVILIACLTFLIALIRAVKGK